LLPDCGGDCEDGCHHYEGGANGFRARINPSLFRRSTDKEQLRTPKNIAPAIARKTNTPQSRQPALHLRETVLRLLEAQIKTRFDRVLMAETSSLNSFRA